MDATYKIRQVGGALVVTIPRHILKIIPLVAGDEVRFTVAQNGKRDNRGLIVIEPERKTIGTSRPRGSKEK